MSEPVDVTFSAPIGVEVKGEMWACVEVPDSAELLGTRKTVRVDLVVDGVRLENAGLLVTGRGGHMFSLNAKLRAQLGKSIGDVVEVRLLSR